MKSAVARDTTRTDTTRASSKRGQNLNINSIRKVYINQNREFIQNSVRKNIELKNDELSDISYDSTEMQVKPTESVKQLKNLLESDIFDGAGVTF